jgi:hypothetical protein
MRAFIAAALMTTASASYAEGPRSYASVDFRAGTVSPATGSYNYVGFDAYGGRRFLQWLAIEGFYAAERVVFVPLHLRFLDVSAGLGVAGVLARERRAVAPAVPASLGCGGAYEGLHGGIVGSTFMSIELRPIARFGVRVTGVLGIANIDDYPTFQFAVGPVVWF